jgi:hypothetical protein
MSIVELCQKIGDKIMERGLLTFALADGNLTCVTLRVKGNKDTFSIIVELECEGRGQKNLSDDEDDKIVDIVDGYFESKQFWSHFEDIGYSRNGCDGFASKLVEEVDPI